MQFPGSHGELFLELWPWGADARALRTNLCGALEQVIPEAPTQSSPCSGRRGPLNDSLSSGCRWGSLELPLGAQFALSSHPPA